jgi:uncharacterized protein
MTMKLKLVLDTNTVLALWMFEDPALEALRSGIEQGGCTLYSRADALEELRRVLAYSQFSKQAADQAALMDAYRGRLSPLPAPAGVDVPLPLCKDRDDQKFLEIASAASATHLLTRDKALLKLARHRLIRARFAILTPEHFLLTVLHPPPSDCGANG